MRIDKSSLNKETNSGFSDHIGHHTFEVITVPKRSSAFSCMLSEKLRVFTVSIISLQPVPGSAGICSISDVHSATHIWSEQN
jgi:hypothetical protein